MAKVYILRIFTGGMRVTDRQIVETLSAKYCLSRRRNLLYADFEKESDITAAEYCRDIMNDIINIGGYIIAAFLRRRDLCLAGKDGYIADWEFEKCKGFSSDEDVSVERLYGLDLKEA